MRPSDWAQAILTKKCAVTYAVNWFAAMIDLKNRLLDVMVK